MKRSVAMTCAFVLSVACASCNALLDVDAHFGERDASAGTTSSAEANTGADDAGLDIGPAPGPDGGLPDEPTDGPPAGPPDASGIDEPEATPAATCPAQTRPCSEGGLLGSCALGTQACQDGEWGECSVLPQVADTCEPGNDDNCNGTPNDDCSCVLGATTPCENALGNCAQGNRSCDAAGNFGPCDVMPAAADACDVAGDDADCDGTPNGGCPPCQEGATQPCVGVELGLCEPGIATCQNGAWGACEGVVSPAARDCRSPQDNDCDGVPDDARDAVCACTPGQTEACADQNGGCRVGVRTCVAGANNASAAWGSCAYDDAVDATACDDGDPATLADSCTGGVCRGRFRLTVDVTGGGSVTAPGIDCPGDCTELYPEGTAVMLRARTTNGSGAYFESWQGECSGSFRDCTTVVRASASVSAVFKPIRYNLMFVSSATVNSNLGGVAAYDALCNSWASAAGINNAAGNAYIAWMSQTGSAMANRLSSSVGGWVRLDGRPVARSRAKLFANEMFYPPDIDEFGRAANNATTYAGTDSNGSKRAGTCNDWTSTSGSTDTGQSKAGPGLWTVFYSSACGALRHIYCFDKTRTAVVPAPPAPPASAKVAYRTADSFPIGGGQSPDAFCNAHKPSGYSSRTFAAYISTTTKRGADAVDSSADYYRLDGVHLGPGTALRSGAALDAGIWVTEDLTYPSGYHLIWTGSTSPTATGSSADTCSNWSSTAGSAGRVGLANRSTSYYSAGTTACTANRGIFCLER